MDSSLPPVPPSAPVSPPIPPPSVPTLTLTPNPQPTTHNPQPISGRPEVETGKPGLGLEAGKETGEIEVIPESPEISPELAEHVERVVRGEIELPGPIEVGTHEGRPVIIEPSASQQPNIVLPLTRGDFTVGPQQPVSSSWRWLYEWVKRIILIFPGRAAYRES